MSIEEPHNWTEAEIETEIINQVYKSLEDLGAPPELLAIVGSWKDTLPSHQVLEMLYAYNSVTKKD